jgi:hypothetical protein
MVEPGQWSRIPESQPEAEKELFSDNLEVSVVYRTWWKLAVFLIHIHFSLMCTCTPHSEKQEGSISPNSEIQISN